MEKINSIDAYIAGFPEEIREILEKVRNTIKSAAPNAIEKISYQMPTFAQNGNLVHFAACSRHIGFYPTPSAIVAFKNELGEYICSKGAIQFPYKKDIPYILIHKMVIFRLNENMSKTKK